MTMIAIPYMVINLNISTGVIQRCVCRSILILYFLNEYLDFMKVLQWYTFEKNFAMLQCYVFLLAMDGEYVGVFVTTQ